MFQSVCFEITSKCNMKCSYCYRMVSDKQNISLADFKKCLIMLKQFGTTIINITGGEALLHPEWHGFIELAYNMRFIVNFSTNTLLLDIDDPIFSKINILAISNDGNGYEDNSSYINRSMDQYKKSVEVIEKYKAGNYPFTLKVNSVLTKENKDSLIHFAAKHLDNKNIVWMVFPYSTKGDLNVMPEELILSTELYENIFQQIKNLNLSSTVMVDHINNILLNNNSYYIITPDSDLYLTFDNKDHFIGNLLTDPFAKIRVSMQPYIRWDIFEDYTGTMRDNNCSQIC